MKLIGYRYVLFAFALVASACSGNSDSNDRESSGGAPGDTPSAECDTTFGPIDPTALIDDMEDGNGLIATVAGRNGSWWVSTDGTDGTITPAADQAPAPERILGGRCGSQQAIRITGQGFTSWGAVLSAGMAYSSQPEPTDASAFTGVMFWARVGEQNTSAIRVQFQDSHTEPSGGVCNPESGSSDECYNGFGTALTSIDTEWRLYKLDFSRMTQRDYGYRADSLDTANIYDIEWNLEPNAVFDLWVDDVWFYE